MSKASTRLQNFLGGGAFLVAIGVFFIIRAVGTINDSSQLDTWQTVPGEVVTSNKKVISGEKPRTIFNFAYRYEVAGKAYTSKRYDMSAISGSPSKGVDRFEVGDAVQVHFDPIDPTKAALEVSGAGAWIWISLLFGVGMTLGGIRFTWVHS
ncbi:MAG: DUF3592 domain-containing protein [Bradymonadia bacterium]